MASLIVRTDETVKRIVILVGQSCFKLIVLGVEPVCKFSTDFVNLRIRHLYGFHIPYLDFLIIDRYLFGNIRSGIDQSVFEQGNTVKGSTFSVDGIFIPYMHILLVAL